MKQLLLIALTTIALSSSAQSKDSTAKKDTVAKTDTVRVPVPVPVFEKSDTVQASALYVDKKSNVKFTKAFVITKGFASQDKQGRWQWVEKPKVIVVMDEKKRPLEKVLQIL